LDNDAEARAMAAAMLYDAGYEVGEVSSGDAAFDVLKHSSSRVELVVADVAAGGLDSVELAAIVQHTWPSLPVLFFIGYGDMALVDLAAGHEMLHKPFQAAELSAKVRRAIARSGRVLAETATRSTRATLP
jgi:DNA-binding NtrC family response regulator